LIFQKIQSRLAGHTKCAAGSDNGRVIEFTFIFITSIFWLDFSLIKKNSFIPESGKKERSRIYSRYERYV